MKLQTQSKRRNKLKKKSDKETVELLAGKNLKIKKKMIAKKQKSEKRSAEEEEEHMNSS